MTDQLRFSFRFHPAFRAAGLPLGIRPESCELVVDDVLLTVRFGPWTLSTQRSNVVGASVSGPYRWAKVIGPPHLSARDRGVTFASNPDQGVCLHFAEPVPALLPVSLLKHPGATVTMENPAGFAELFISGLGGSNAGLNATLLSAHDDLNSLSPAQLRTRAKDLGIRGTSAMSKSDLVEALEPDGVGASHR